MAKAKVKKTTKNEVSIFDEVPVEETPVVEAEASEPQEESKEKAKKAAPRKGTKKVRGKRYLALVKDLDKSRAFAITEAVEVIKSTSKTKFNSSVEVHMNLNLDVTKADQTIRSTVVLPHASTKKIKILVFTNNPAADLKAEGVEVGDKKTISDIASTGKVVADKIIATPDMMPELSAIARILGPKGLMPNPKTGTVTSDVKKTIADLQGGMVEYRTENRPIVHATLGRASQDNEKLVENFKALFEAVSGSRPKGAKGDMIKSVYITSTMGPSVQVDLSSVK